MQSQLNSFPNGFRTEEIRTNGATLKVRVGGSGPAILMLHGFNDRTDRSTSLWASAATGLYEENRVLVPELRGTEWSALDILCVLNQLEIERVDLVTHELGNQAGYAFASLFPNRVKRWVAIGNWEKPEVKEKLSIPILALGAELKSIASRVEGAVAPNDDWGATTRLIVNFLVE